jgi:hypothetical protein
MLPKMIIVDGLLMKHSGLPKGYAVVWQVWDRDAYQCAPKWLAWFYRLLPNSCGWRKPPYLGAGYFVQWIMWPKWGIARVERDGYYWLLRLGKYSLYVWTSLSAYKRNYPTTPWKPFTWMKW